MSTTPPSSRLARFAQAYGVSREQLEVAAVVTFYMIAALVMVFVNKAVLLSTPTLPLVFLLIQLLMAVVLLHLFAFAAPRHVQLPRFDVATARKLAPVITVSLGGLIFNTLCLRAVEAAFFQIARGMLLPLTIVVSALATRALPRPLGPVLIAALIVTLGFLLGIAPAHLVDIIGGIGESAGVTAPTVPAARGTTPLAGLGYGLLSAVFTAVHSVLIKSSLPHVGGSALALAYWTNAVSALALAPIALLLGEGAEFLRLAAGAAAGGAGWAWGTFVWGSLVTGVFGALLGVAGMLSVKVTSPVTHMFSSAAKSVLQSVLGVFLFGDAMTNGRASSISIILVGTLYYTWVKSTLPPPPPRPADVEAARPKDTELSSVVEFEIDDKDLEE